MNTKFIWGGDYQRTMPETFGTILPDGKPGRNPISFGSDGKDNDGDGEVDEWDELLLTNEFGLYALSQSKLNDKFQLILSGRVDLHSGQQEDGDWGPWTLGGAHEQQIQHSRRTKGTKVSVVGPRKTDFAEKMDQFIGIRPGSEPFMLLGMLVAVVKGGWGDQQYIDDYTSGYSELQEILEPWTV